MCLLYYLITEGFDKPAEHVNFKVHRKRNLHGVNAHFEHRTTQKLARAGGLQSLLTLYRAKTQSHAVIYFK